MIYCLRRLAKMSRIHQYSLSIVLLQILIHKEMQRFFLQLVQIPKLFAIIFGIQIQFLSHFFLNFFLNIFSIFSTFSSIVYHFSQIFFIFFFKFCLVFFQYFFQLWFYVKSCFLTIDFQIRKKKILWFFLLLTQRILKSQEKSLNVAKFKPIITLPFFCYDFLFELCCSGKSLLFLPLKKKLMTNSAECKKWCLFSKPLIIKEPIRDEKNGESFLGENTNYFAF